MLSDRVHRLLTAYVDGELNDRQRLAVLRILEESGEAKELLGRLQSDVAALRKLPAQKLPADFSGRIMNALGQEPARAASGRMWKLPGNVLAWSGMAASVVLAAGIGSSGYFMSRVREPLADDVVAMASRESAPERIKERLDEPSRALEKKDAAPASKPAMPAPAPPAPMASAGPDNKAPALAGAAPTPDRGPDKAPKEPGFGSPLKNQKLEVVPPSLPLTYPLSELRREERSQRLKQELAHQKAIQVELWCKGNGKAAVDRLQGAFEAQGVGLLVDAEARARLQQRQKQATYLLYAQEITAAELVGILEQLAEEDAKAENTRRGSGQFDSIVVLNQTPQVRQDLFGVLSVDPLQQLARGSLAGDARRSIAAGGAKLAAESVEGRGSARAEAGKSAVKMWERSALVLSYNPVRIKSLPSVEIKQFLETRKPRRAEAVQVFLVLRHN